MLCASHLPVCTGGTANRLIEIQRPCHCGGILLNGFPAHEAGHKYLNSNSAQRLIKGASP